MAMVKEIVGYDNEGNEVFRREARKYDHSLANTVFGISIGDVVKAIPIVFLCGVVWTNQQHVNEKMLKSLDDNSVAIMQIRDVLDNLNSYLSSSTGKPFKNGLPR